MLKSRSCSRPLLAGLFALAQLLLAGSANAQGEANLARADALFQQGKELLQEKRFAEACPKLKQSHDLDPATGTLIALAVCHEGLGKTASAWAEFTTAAAVARQEGRSDRVAFANERAGALSTRLSRLKVQVASETASLKGFKILVDGAELGSALWGTWVPMDPGQHVVEASLPTPRPWSVRVQLRDQGDERMVLVPALGRTPLNTSPGSAARDDSRERGNAQRSAGWIVGGVGALSVGVGSYFGVRALQQHDDTLARCPTSRCTDPEAVRLNDAAKVFANLANVGIALGVAGLAIGTVLVLSAPRSKLGTSPAKTSLMVGPAGLAWRLGF